MVIVSLFGWKLYNYDLRLVEKRACPNGMDL